jgi:hypothetical protein
VLTALAAADRMRALSPDAERAWPLRSGRSDP